METDQLIKEQLAKLPEAERVLIASGAWAESLRSVVVENHLDENQASNLETETFLVLTGIEEKENYISNIVRELGVSPQIGESIGQIVDERIFAPILGNNNNQTVVPPADEKLLEPPKEVAEVGPKSFYGTHIEKPVEAKIIEPTPVRMTSYPGGVDPYRETTS